MTRLAVFAKPPRAGKVKTRLIPDLGADGAAIVYRHCLQHAIGIAGNAGVEYRIYLSEADEDPLFQMHPIGYQRGSDLGERMLNALTEMLEQAPDGAIIVGTDCLDLETSHITAAKRALVDHELVLLPAIDGGYALIGCRIIDRALFDRVSWSTAEVLKQTMANANKLGYRTYLLETVRDIDTLQDMEHYPELIDLVSPG